MATNLLEFEEQDANFLFLNILGHDVIHDYGEPNSERWKKNRDLILENYGGAAAFISNTPQTLDTNHVFKFVDKNQIPNTDVDDFTKNKMHWKPEDYEILSKQEDDIFINQIKSDILLRVFKYIFLNKNTPTEYPLEINDLVENCLKYDDEDEDENKLKNIYNQIADDFKNKNKNNKLVNGKQVIEILGKYLEKYFLTLLLSADQNTKPKTKGGANGKKITKTQKVIIKKSGKEFRAFIAKMALHVTDAIVNKTTTNWALEKEIELLSNISDPEKSISKFDKNLYETFETEYKQYKTKNFKCETGNKYIINNASHINLNTVRGYGFCPYSSIIDGMTQCSLESTDVNGIETGNMDFTIRNLNNTSKYYRGMSKIDQEKQTISITLDIQLPKIKINTQKIVNYTDKEQKELQAWFVLKNTLEKILDYLEENKNILQSGENVFESLFQYGSQTQLPTTIFQTIYNEILFKGVGDLFQEINAVTKNGGYVSQTKTKTETKTEIEKFNNSGDAIRLFVANDRPSACRFMFMLINGNSDQINTKAFGGYFRKTNIFLIKRPENNDICIYETNANNKRNRNSSTTSPSNKNPRRTGGRKTKRKHKKPKRKTHKNTSNISSYPQNP